MFSGEVDFYEFVYGFFRVGIGYDCKVDGLVEIDEIGVGLIFDFDSFCFFFFFIGIVVIVIIVVVFVVVVVFFKNFCFEFFVCFFVFFLFWVEFEDV